MELLPLGNYRLSFVAIDDIPIRKFSGSAWRGLFGHSLKKTLCLTRNRECGHCLLLYGCGYSYLFETPPPPDTEKMRRYPDAPRPFVLLPLHDEAMCFRPGEYFSIGLRLFGRANHHLPHIIQAWKNAGASGLGRGARRFQLAAVEQESEPGSGQWKAIYQPKTPLPPLSPAPPKPPPLPGNVQIRLISPLRLQQEGRLLPAEALTFGNLFRPLLRRISMLSYFHSEQPLEVDFRQLSRQSDSVELISPELGWQQQRRYSSRQNSSISMSGIRGRFNLDPEQIEPFWPYLWLGQWTGVGKGTVMGLGQYSINPKTCSKTSL